MKIGTRALIVIVISYLVLVGGLFSVFQFIIIPWQIDSLEQQSSDLAYSLQKISPLLDARMQQELYEQLGKTQANLSYALITDNEGRAVIHSNPGRVGMLFNDPDSLKAIKGEDKTQSIFERDKDNPHSPVYGQKTVDILVPYYSETGEHIGAIRVGISMQKIDNLKNQYYGLIALVGILLSIFSLAIGLTLTRGLINPIKQLALATREANDSISGQFAVRRRDEIGVLAREYVLMGERTSALLDGLQKRERELQEYIDQLLTINCKVAPDGTVLMINAGMAKFVGPGSNKMLGKNLSEFAWGGFGPNDGYRLKQLLTKAASGVTVCSEEFSSINNGQGMTLDVGIRPVLNTQMEVAYLVVEAVDISDRKQAEQKLKYAHDQLELRVKERTIELEKTNEVLKKQIMQRKQIEKALLESEGLLQNRVDYLNTLISNLNEFFFVYDKDGQITFANNKSFETLGYVSAELIGIHVAELVSENSRYLIYNETEDRLIRGLRGRYEAPVVCKDGQERILRISSSPIVEHGEIIGGMVLGEDITNYRRAEEALRMSEEKFSTAFLLSTELMSIITSDGKILEINDSMLRHSGYTREEVIGKTMAELNVWVYPEDRRRILRMLKEKGSLMNEETSLRNKAGEVRRVLCSLATIDINGEKCVLFECHDITTRKKMEEDLAREKERLQVTLKSIGDGVIATDIEGKVVLSNEASERILGKNQSELLGIDFLNVIKDLKVKFLNPDNQRDPGNKLLPNAVFNVDGEERVVETNRATMCDEEGRPMGTVWAIRDITDKQKMEEELLKASKLESLGVLAGGIAHDFNNLLTVVVGNLALSKMMLQGEQEIIENLTEAEKASFQAKGLTQQLLTFARGGVPIKKTLVLDQLLRDSASLALSGSNVRCEYQISQDLWAVDIDEGQMNQVINNLILNAVQSMPAGGIIKINAYNVIIIDEEIPPLPGGRYVRISITDNGTGIPEELHHRIFDPYFTTKTMGSGLGLATSYSIIRKHDGYITLDSEPDKGSTFYLYLPASAQEIEINRDGPEVIIPGRGRILIVDDDNRIREVARQILDSIGYEVEQAGDGAEAIAIYQAAIQRGEKFDLIVIDLTIPGGMGGQEAAKKLIEIDPGVKLIVSSGYSNDPVMAEYGKWGFKGVIAKPYGIRELSETIARVINQN